MPSKSSRQRSRQQRLERQRQKRAAVDSPVEATLPQEDNGIQRGEFVNFTTPRWIPRRLASQESDEFIQRWLIDVMTPIRNRDRSMFLRSTIEKSLTPEERQRKEHAMKFL